MFKLVERYKHNRRFELSYLRMLLRKYPAAQARALEAYRDKHAGEVGVIIANGPSLNDICFEDVRGFVTIGMNRVDLLEDRFQFRPDYYCLEDHMVAEDNHDRISALQGSVMFIPRDLSYCIRGNPNILYTNMSRRYKGARQASQFSTDFPRRVYWGGTVTYYALQLAYFLGFGKVYIIGLDHSYARPESARGQKIVSQGDDVNHFDPRYFGKGKRWHAPDNLVERMEISYRLAREVFDAAGREIINATPASKLGEDVFPRMSFEDVPELATSPQ